jgi:hypothetical protein
MEHTVMKTALLFGIIAVLSAQGLCVELTEGAGCGNLKIGMSEPEAIQAVGTPQKSWLVWEDRCIDCLVISGKVVEIRINKGSDAEFATRIGMDSTTEEIKEAYGEPEATRTGPNVETWRYADKGILFWIIDGTTINQIVIAKPIEFIDREKYPQIVLPGSQSSQ